MNHRVLAVLFVAGLLGGCTDADWDHAFAYAGIGTPKPDATPPEAAANAPPPAYVAAPTPSVTTGPAPAADTWCIDVAKSAQTEAAQQGFDGATQQHRALTAFNQCSRNRAQ